ncbi:MAG: MaoC/PaaZ C-terminal domain-containing protein [Actinomycetota bacterium]
MGAPSNITLDAVTPGMDLGPVVYGPLSREDLVRYARASGDDNPIHQDDEYARSQGAPSVFAHGMLSAGYLAHAVSDWFGGPTNLQRYKVRFTARMWPGDEIVCTGKVQEIEDGVIKVTMEACRRGPGPEGLGLEEEQVALLGEADVVLPE